jgi:hypothetical protein
LAAISGIKCHERRHPEVIQIKDITDADPFFLQPAYEEDVCRYF